MAPNSSSQIFPRNYVDCQVTRIIVADGVQRNQSLPLRILWALGQTDRRWTRTLRVF
jgi:hypothetical protein